MAGDGLKGATPDAGSVTALEVFYEYEDADGARHFTTSLEEIPAAFRRGARRLELPKREAEGLVERGMEEVDEARRVAGEGLREVQKVQRKLDGAEFLSDLDAPSAGVGAAATLLAVLVMSIFRRTGALVFRLGLVLAIVALLGSSYFGWLRRAAGLSDRALSSPTALIKDAKGAAAKVKTRIREEQRTLKKIEEEAR